MWNIGTTMLQMINKKKHLSEIRTNYITMKFIYLMWTNAIFEIKNNMSCQKLWRSARSEQRTLGIASVPQGTKQFIALNGERACSARWAEAIQQQQPIAVAVTSGNSPAFVSKCRVKNWEVISEWLEVVLNDRMVKLYYYSNIWEVKPIFLKKINSVGILIVW